MAKTPIKDRIRQHFRIGITYHELMRLVFPEDEYPQAMRPSINGGPPGCAMAFERALKACGLRREWDCGDVIRRTKDCEF